MFITEQEFSQLDCKMLNELCDKLVRTATEEALKALPFVVGSIINQAGTLKDMAIKFYDENKDLAEHKMVVAKLIEKEEQINPDKTFEEILKIVAPKAREAIKQSSIANVEAEQPTLKKIDSVNFGVL